MSDTPLSVGSPTVALGGATLRYGAIQVYNPPGDSGSPSISLVKYDSGHTTTVRAVQLGVDVNGLEVSTDLAGPVIIINSQGQLAQATTQTTGAVPPLVTPGSGSGQQTQVWLRGDNSWQPPPSSVVPAIIWGEIPSGLIDGINQNYTSAHAYLSGRLAVFLNGLRQRRLDDYTETGSNSFRFLYPPVPNDSLSIDYIQPQL